MAIVDKVVNMHHAKSHLCQLLQAVERGEEVVIARDGVPVARLVAWREHDRPGAAPGAMRGRIRMDNDCDAPLDGLFDALR